MEPMPTGMNEIIIDDVGIVKKSLWVTFLLVVLPLANTLSNIQASPVRTHDLVGGLTYASIKHGAHFISHLILENYPDNTP